MCFHARLAKLAIELQNRFRAEPARGVPPVATVYNGFQHPQTPVILDRNPQLIQLADWGLIPQWAKDESIRKHTLNARIETLTEKPSFRDVIHNRCMILADGFFEWQWLDPSGRNKAKYAIGLPEGEAFAFAGIWSNWTDPSSGEVRTTYSILTTEANPLMAEIHNTKKRMPAILDPQSEGDWLLGGELVMGNDALVAERIDGRLF